jgi:hypothetical protein
MHYVRHDFPLKDFCPILLLCFDMIGWSDIPHVGIKIQKTSKLKEANYHSRAAVQKKIGSGTTVP